jgi:ELWxxDGT repeat protein
VRALATLLFAATAFAAPPPAPYLVKDLAPDRYILGEWIDDTNRVVAGDAVYSGAFHPASGLWRTDGTLVGTYRVDNDAPGATQRLWQPLVAKDGLVYYAVESGHEYFLYRTDGTTPGTQRVAQLPARPYELAPCADGKICFALEGNQIGVTDGTTAGTTILRVTGPASAETFGSRYLTPFGGKVFFNAYDEEAGRCDGRNRCGELWTSDGTVEGTHIVKDLVPGTRPSSPTNLFANAGKLYFKAIEPVLRYDCRVWVSDGTAEGTRILLPAVPLDCSSSSWGDPYGPKYFAYRDRTYIVTTNTEVYRTDGTIEGTSRLTDFLGWGDVIGIVPIPADDSMLLVVTRGVEPTKELWSFDGEHATRIGDAPDLGRLLGYLPATGRVYHVLGLGVTEPKELWSFDGKVHEKVWQFPTANTGNVTLWGATRRFLAFRVAGASQPDAKLWATDGTAAGTIRLPLEGTVGRSSMPTDFLSAGNKLYFSTHDGTSFHATDGTSGNTITLGSGLNRPSPILKDGRVYFRGTSNSLVSTDGTTAGTHDLALRFGVAGQIDEPPAYLGETAIFRTGTTLARRDPNGAVHLLGLTRYTFNFTTVGNDVLFTAVSDDFSHAIYATDGTAEGTRVLLSGLHLPGGGRAARILPDGERAFFGAKQEPAADAPLWLWVTDRTPAGTRRVKTLGTEQFETLLPDFMWHGAAIFRVGYPSLGGKVWRSDGTEAGTFPLSGVTFRHVVDSGDRLTLVGEVGGVAEIWTSDATIAGTTRRRAIPRTFATRPFQLAGGGTAVALIAWEAPSEVEIYNVTTGSSTFVPLRTVQPFIGTGTPGIANLAYANGRVFFTGYRVKTGAELWAIPVESAPVEQEAAIGIAYVGLTRLDGRWGAMFRVTMNAEGSELPTVVASTVDGTLIAGRDYTPFTRELEFDDEHDVTLVVPILGVGGTVSVALSSPTNGRIVRGFATADVPRANRRRAATH